MYIKKIEKFVLLYFVSGKYDMENVYWEVYYL